MARIPGQRTRLPRAVVIIICGAVAAASGGLAAGCSRSPAAQPETKCGSAVTHFLTAHTQVITARHGALTCFVTAARHCRAASLAVTEMAVDTGTHVVFTIKPGGSPCQVTETSQNYSVNFGGSHGPRVTRSCRLTGATSAGATLRCGAQTVLIPAKADAPPLPS